MSFLRFDAVYDRRVPGCLMECGELQVVYMLQTDSQHGLIRNCGRTAKMLQPALDLKTLIQLQLDLDPKTIGYRL